METIAFRLPLPTGSSKVLSSGSQLSLGQLCLGHGREHRHTSKIIGSSIRQHSARTDRGENETLLSETLSQFQVQSGEGWWDSWKLSSQVHCLGDRCLWRAGQWFRNHWLTSEMRWLLPTPRPVTGRLFFPSCIWKKKNLRGGQRTHQCGAKSMRTWSFDWWWSPRRHTLLSPSLQRTTWNRKRLRIMLLSSPIGGSQMWLQEAQGAKFVCLKVFEFRALPSLKNNVTVV